MITGSPFISVSDPKGCHHRVNRPWFGHKLTILGFLFPAILLAAPSQAQEATVDLSTTITGNREQPKVLYIVPWKAVNDSELEEQTIQSQLDIVFGHVERIELQRELQFIEAVEKTADSEDE